MSSPLSKNETDIITAPSHLGAAVFSDNGREGFGQSVAAGATNSRAICSSRVVLRGREPVKPIVARRPGLLGSAAAASARGRRPAPYFAMPAEVECSPD